MPCQGTPLSDTKIKSLKPRPARHRTGDAGGLLREITSCVCQVVKIGDQVIGSVSWRRWLRAGLWLGLGLGTAFSIFQVAEGAHFMSNNLLAPAIDLWMTALVFSPLLAPGCPSPLYANSVLVESQP